MSVDYFTVYTDGGPTEITVEYLDEAGEPRKACLWLGVRGRDRWSGNGGDLVMKVDGNRVWHSRLGPGPPKRTRHAPCPHCGRKPSEPASPHQIDSDTSQWKPGRKS